jgi:hypothetical protein
VDLTSSSHDVTQLTKLIDDDDTSSSCAPTGTRHQALGDVSSGHFAADSASQQNDVTQLTDLIDYEAVKKIPPKDIDITTLASSSNDQHIVVFEDGVRFKIKLSRKSTCTAPLDPIATPSFNYSALERMWEMELPPHPDFVMMLSWIRDDVLVDKLKPLLPTDATECKVTRDPLLQQEMKDWSKQDTVIRCLTLLNALVFKVPKSSGGARLVYDGRKFNDLLKLAGLTVPNMPLASIQEVVKRILTFRYISSADATSMFYQFAVGRLRTLFGFKVGGRRGKFDRYAMAALPMGVSFAPAWAQHVANYICSIVKKRMKGAHCDILSWVDNFILLSDCPEVHRQLDAHFSAVCKELGLKLKPYNHEPSTSMDVLGLSFNLDTRTVEPTLKLKTDLAQRLQEFFHDGAALHFLQFTGTTMFVNYAINHAPLCMYPATMEMLREICRAQAWQSTVSIHEELRAEMKVLEEACRTAKHQPAPPTQLPERTVWTDASTQALAAYDERTRESWYHPLPAQFADQPRLMAVWEMTAVKLAAEHFDLDED